MTSDTYVVYIMSGLVPFLGFTESLNSGAVSLSGKTDLLLYTVYPSQFIPFQSVLLGHSNLFTSLIFIIILKFIFLQHFSYTLIYLPFLIIFQLMFTARLVCFLSILSLLVKDIPQILPFMTIFLMIVSPIAYTPDMVPSKLKLLIWINPFSYFVKCYQGIFVSTKLGWAFIVVTLLSISFYWLGYLFYQKAKRAFYDYV